MRSNTSAPAIAHHCPIASLCGNHYIRELGEQGGRQESTQPWDLCQQKCCKSTEQHRLGEFPVLFQELEMRWRTPVLLFAY
jgi:hypothetical protein